MKTDCKPGEVTTQEQWREVPGWPAYKVSNMGRVMGRSGMLRPSVQRGYKRFTLRDRDRTAWPFVHALVLTVFVRPKEPNEQARHLNGVRDDNRLENLCWGTARENYADKVEHGTAQVGMFHGRRKLTEEQVQRIRTAYASRTSQHWGATELAREMGVDKTTVQRIGKAESWQCIEFAPEAPSIDAKDIDRERLRTLAERCLSLSLTKSTWKEWNAANREFRAVASPSAILALLSIDPATVGKEKQ